MAWICLLENRVVSCRTSCEVVPTGSEVLCTQLLSDDKPTVARIIGQVFLFWFSHIS